MKGNIFVGAVQRQTWQNTQGTDHIVVGPLTMKLPSMVISLMFGFLLITSFPIFTPAPANAAPVLISVQTIPTIPYEPPKKSGGPKFGVKCGRCHELSIYDPHSPVTERNNNHSTIQRAINNTRPGGKVIIYRDRNKPFLDPFTVTRANLTVEAADAQFGGTVVIAQADNSCVTIAPEGNDRFSDVTTKMVGFTFVGRDGSSKPCVDVRKGRLLLVDSRVQISSASGTGIRVAATAELEFTGKNYDEHGVFAPSRGNLSGPATHMGTGLVALGSKAIKITGVRFQGLEYGAITRAESNQFFGVRFVNNKTALQVEDAAVVSAYAPRLDIIGGAFSFNDDGLIITASGFGASMPENNGGILNGQSGLFASPFRAAVTIGTLAEDPVRFDRNKRGIRFVDARPTRGFVIENAQFLGHRDYAIKLNLPQGSGAAIRRSQFFQNARAIILDNALNGQLTIDQGTSITGIPSFHKGIEIQDGDGTFKAQLSSVAGVTPAFFFGPDWDGLMDIAIDAPVLRDFLIFDDAHPVCIYNMRNRDERAAFIQEVSDLGVSVLDISLEALYELDESASRNRARLAQGFLCGQISDQQ